MFRPALALAALALSASAARAQRAPLIGTVSPSAVGPAVQQPAPIGGLRTVPLSSARAPGNGMNASPGTGRAYPYGYGSPYGDQRDRRVLDAPLPRGLGGRETYDGASFAAAPRWLPTYDKPRWVPDTTVAPSPLWRALIVTDVVCTPAASCQERTQRIRATWMAHCDCYAFADGWSRVWRVGTRTRSSVPARAPSPIRMVRTDSTE